MHAVINAGIFIFPVVAIFFFSEKALIFSVHKDFWAETQSKAEAHEYFKELRGQPSLKT